MTLPSAPEPGPNGYYQRVARTLSELRQRVPQTGLAILSFGAFPGATDTSVAVTGQAGIAPSSIVRAELALIATADHSADEHLVEPIGIRAGLIVPNVGFTIYGLALSVGDVTTYGQWTVQWSWS